MKKFINIFLAILITLFSFPINGTSVGAEGKVYEEGTHGIKLTLLKDGSDEVSSANDFAEGDDAKLIVNNDKYTVQLTINNKFLVESFSS